MKMMQQADRLLLSLVDAQHRWKIRLFCGWHNIIGDLYDKVRIERVYDSTLLLGVCHSAWAQELYMLSDQLKYKINSFLREDKIKRIRFVTVSFLPHCIDEAMASHAANSGQLSLLSIKPHCCHATLTREEKMRLTSIKNNALKISLREFYLTCKRRSGNEQNTKCKPLVGCNMDKHFTRD